MNAHSYAMQKKSIFLFLALILPVLIFVFLKFFGRNEFAVTPLFIENDSEIPEGCLPVSFPYHIQDSVLRQLDFREDSLALVLFGESNDEAKIQINRIMDEISNDDIRMIRFPAPGEKILQWKKCIFFLKEPFDLVLVDRNGLIRGQYTSGDREDVDRLLMEITIILKRY
ncbi:MAG TPA: hypothetical protein PLJ60_17890 [Chryseolinea sp.]|nr:hypothetical protein [Chryseolinea sp.]